MKISVKVKAGTSIEKVEKTGERDYSVWVRARAVDGKANEAVIRALAGHFGVAKSKVALIRGLASRQKVFDVDAHV